VKLIGVCIFLSIEDVLKFTVVEHDGQIEKVKNANQAEIDCIKAELRNFKKNESGGTIGIITPFHDQQTRLIDKINKLPDRDNFFEQRKLKMKLKIKYEYPHYRMDCLLWYKNPSGQDIKIIIEFDDFHQGVNGPRSGTGRHQEYYSDKDVEREKTLESNGYQFLRLNRFNIGQDPVVTIDQRLSELVGPSSSVEVIVGV